MSEQTNLTYAAIITISLPGTDTKATASVTLTPADAVPMAQQSKRLTDCTLADLQQFAEQWQADVWATYDEITLLDLVADTGVDVDIALIDESGEKRLISEEILQEMVVQLSHLKPVAEDSVEDVPVVDEVAEIPVMATAVAANITIIPDTADDEQVEPQIHISEPESVYEEREVTGTEAITPDIMPSRARVRLAGQRLPIGHTTWMAVDIFWEEPAFRAAQAHALSSLNREVAGVLIGPPPEKQPDGRYVVHIFDTIIAKHTVMKGASVTYTPESWRYMSDRLLEKYPDGTAVMVGWYHTHPGFGIFLSGMDQFIHQNFFTQIWHVAQVLDPVARTSGFFCWNREKTNVKRIDYPWPEWAAGSW
jgi:proteasome lid subunit RPN8/RPN11